MHGTTDRLDAQTLESLARLEALAKLMDGAFVIPGTTIRFGLWVGETIAASGTLGFG